jgi:hypothetical protein
MHRDTTGPGCTSSTPEEKSAWRDISWSAFVELPDLTRAVSWNVYNAIDGDGRGLSKAAIRFLARHGVNRVYAPGCAP